MAMQLSLDLFHTLMQERESDESTKYLCNLFYEISLYFFIILSPKDGNQYVTAFFFFTWIISGLISGIPSLYVQMGFNLPKKHLDFDAIAKLTQILIVSMPRF